MYTVIMLLLNIYLEFAHCIRSSEFQSSLGLVRFNFNCFQCPSANTKQDNLIIFTHPRISILAMTFTNVAYLLIYIVNSTEISLFIISLEQLISCKEYLIFSFSPCANFTTWTTCVPICLIPQVGTHQLQYVLNIL